MTEIGTALDLYAAFKCHDLGGIACINSAGAVLGWGKLATLERIGVNSYLPTAIELDVFDTAGVGPRSIGEHPVPSMAARAMNDHEHRRPSNRRLSPMTAEASAAMGQYLAERIHILERGVALLPKRQRLAQELRAWRNLQDTLGTGVDR